MSTNPTNKNHLFQSVANRLSKLFGKDGEASTGTVSPADVAAPETRSRVVTLAKLPPFQAKANLEQYLREHIGDPGLDIASMAAALKTSRTALFEFIHATYGMTPGNYILSRRLDLAKYYLLEGNRASAVARRCGFADPKYFGKVFKKHVGVLPSQYKSTIEQNP